MRQAASGSGLSPADFEVRDKEELRPFSSLSADSVSREWPGILVDMSGQHAHRLEDCHGSPGLRLVGLNLETARTSGGVHVRIFTARRNDYIQPG